MARKKKTQQSEAANDSPQSVSSPSASFKSKSKFGEQQPSTSALIICRNKHWRYISSFHGPWLQLPPEVLETLAHSNYFAPRPCPIDPAVFYDIVKIRKAVDEASNLAVRATNGVASSALNNSLNAGNGMLGGGSAAALGLGFGGGNAKLSRERKHRMRELATQKLSQAYHLDEIAASVATMQSASSLEDVASHVLQRNADDPDGKYVHFFHEKIPSRTMAESTPLDPLNEVIAAKPADGEPFRTRALTRLFKEDYIGAARDLSDALTAARYKIAQHRARKDQLVLASAARAERAKTNRHGSPWRQDQKVQEEDQPSSLETQLLFHRAGVYLTLACQHIHEALDAMHEANEAALQNTRVENGTTNGDPPSRSPAERNARIRHLDARKAVKSNAKRALRDYMGFLGNFDYTPGLPYEITQEFLQRVNDVASGSNGFKASRSQSRRLLDKPSENAFSGQDTSSALIRRKKSPIRESDHFTTNGNGWPLLPPNEIYQVSELFASTPPSNLPPFPTPPSYPTSLSLANSTPKLSEAATNALQDSHEAITYHPLLTDALHSLLLCHALLQTSPKELLRHAHNAARLARVCDGYPVFLAARSPARADWIEVLRRAGDWIGLGRSWESLCKPAPLPGHAAHTSHNSNAPLQSRSTAPPPETAQQKRERRKHEAILEALADERVVDEASFAQAVRARERRAIEDEARGGESPYASGGVEGDGTATMSGGVTPPPPKRWAQEDGKEYPISTERAEAVARWVREAPLTIEGMGKGKKAGKKGKAKRNNGTAGDVAGGVETGLENGVAGLGLEVEENSENGHVEEEVD
ncbi:hypothetical protein EV356DRAFT_486724 [Viridothelium virens]|uniref:Histidine kinase group protein n=1 Tax=Viridothelium virens TaxID=1048519 RepID=A0A6A6H608_VIRVR|nr:hypothetical protein EV356DRAFT_486724 [Viridothelium virens]